jgi:crotonobetainyl-CoA:carnitine CoA-transferase CaiB-like acyl-CoA transferase
VRLLEGVRVIDVTMWAFVPSAGGVLAHWGADVIKIEGPGRPDPMRLYHGGSLEKGDAGWMFKHYSRGKRSIGLNLATKEGHAVLSKLVEGADVFLTSYLTETRNKLGIDVGDIRSINPNIVYVRGSGQGPRGPESERGGYDQAAWWCRGSLAHQAMTATGVEWPPGMIGHGDGMAGMTLAGGICAALLHRAMTGEACVVDGSLMGTAMWFNGPAIISAGLGRPFGGVMPQRETMHPTMNMYRTKDGRFINLCMLGDFDDEWVDFCEHLGRPELATDVRFATSSARQEHAAEGVEILDAVFAERTLGEWKKALVTSIGVWAPVQTPDEMADDPQTEANGFLREVQYPSGAVRLPAPPILFDEEAGDPPRAPDYAEHTDEILAELGYDGTTIDLLRSGGTVV